MISTRDKFLDEFQVEEYEIVKMLEIVAEEIVKCMNEAKKGDSDIISFLVSKKTKNSSIFNLSHMKNYLKRQIRKNDLFINNNPEEIELILSSAIFLFLNRYLYRIKKIKTPTLLTSELKLTDSQVYDVSIDMADHLNLTRNQTRELAKNIRTLEDYFIPESLRDEELLIICFFLSKYDSQFQKIRDSTSGKEVKFEIGRIIESLVRSGLDIYDSIHIIEVIKDRLLEKGRREELETDFIYRVVREHLIGEHIGSLHDFIKQSTGLLVVDTGEHKEEILGAGRKYKYLESITREKFEKRRMIPISSVTRSITRNVASVLPYLSIADEKHTRPVFTRKENQKREISFKVSYHLIEGLIDSLVEECCSDNNIIRSLEGLSSCAIQEKETKADIIEKAILSLFWADNFLKALIELPISLETRIPGHKPFVIAATSKKAEKKLRKIVLKRIDEKGISMQSLMAFSQIYGSIHRVILQFKEGKDMPVLELKNDIDQLILKSRHLRNIFVEESGGKSNEA